MSPVLGRPPRASRSRPVNPGAKGPRMGKGTTAMGKPTRAPRATGPDKARRTTRGHEAHQRGTPPATATAHGQVLGNKGHWVLQTQTARTTTTQPRPRGDTEGKMRPSSARETGRPGLDRPGWVKQQEPPPPGFEHPGTSGGESPPDWNIRGGTSSRRHGEPQKRPRGRGRGDAAKQGGWPRPGRSGENKMRTKPR